MRSLADTDSARIRFILACFLPHESNMRLYAGGRRISTSKGCIFFKVHLLLLFVCHASFGLANTPSLHSTSPLQSHSHALSAVSTSMHLVSAVFVPVVDFDASLCHTRIDITLRSMLQAPCVDSSSHLSDVSVCSSMDVFTFNLLNISLSVLPIASSSSKGELQQRFMFGAEHAVHAVLSGGVTLSDMGSAHQVRVFAVQSSHSHTMQWCGSAAMRVAVQADLHYSTSLGMHGLVHSVQTGEFVVVHLPEKACVDLDEQKCFDLGSDAGCFWCDRARKCVHSHVGFDDAAAQCSALPEPDEPPALDRYSSVRCTGGLQTWPLVAPLSNRNRICMMRSVCIADGRLTLFLPPLSNDGAFAESHSSLYSVRGMAHYDGWSSLTHIHHDEKHDDGDRTGFVPQVKNRHQPSSRTCHTIIGPFILCRYKYAYAGRPFAHSVRVCRCR